MKFIARIVDYHGDEADDGWTIDAWDAQDAAEEAVERMENEGDPLQEDENLEVIVTDPKGVVTKWSVVVGLVKTYRADKIEQ